MAARPTIPRLASNNFSPNLLCRHFGRGFAYYFSTSRYCVLFSSPPCVRDHSRVLYRQPNGGGDSHAPALAACRGAGATDYCTSIAYLASSIKHLHVASSI